MPKPLTRLKMLISCTSELQAERGLVDRIVGDVNRTIEDAYGVTIRVIDWRRDIVPGVGTDPQQVINTQTADCELYLGMLSTRFGTATPRAGSGTEDEFNTVYQRFREDPRSLRLLFYFRTGAPGGVLDIDPEQLKGVQQFRERLGTERGVLYCDFNAAEEFMQLLRDHLIQLVRSDWDTSSAQWRPVPGLEPVTQASIGQLVGGTATSSDDDSLGPLDLRVRMDESFEAAMAAVRGVTELMSNSAEADRQWMARVQTATTSRVNPRDAQALINTKAADFGRRSKELQSLRGAFRTAAEEFFATLSQLSEFQIQSGLSTREEIESGLKRIVVADSVVRAARDTYLSIAASVARLPEPTREFRTQKRRLMQQVELFSADIGAWLDRSANLRARFNLVDDGDPTDPQ